MPSVRSCGNGRLSAQSVAQRSLMASEPADSVRPVVSIHARAGAGSGRRRRTRRLRLRDRQQRPPMAARPYRARRRPRRRRRGTCRLTWLCRRSASWGTVARCAALHWRWPGRGRAYCWWRRASVEERRWAERERRNVTGCCCGSHDAGRVGCVAACGVPAGAGLPRHGLPAGRLPCLPSRARRPRAGRVPLVLLIAGLGAYALTQLIEAVFRPSHATGTMGRWRQRAVSSWGCLLYLAFCLSTARLLARTPPKQTAQSEQRQDTDVTALLLRTGWGRVLLILVGVLVLAAGWRLAAGRSGSISGNGSPQGTCPGRWPWSPGCSAVASC